MINKIFRLILSPTPAIGRRIRNAGVALITGGGATLAASTQLPAVPDSWMEFAKAIVEILSAVTILIGTLMAGAGQTQVKDDPDKI